MWAYWLRHQKGTLREKNTHALSDRLQHCTRPATKNSTVVLNCSLKSISSNYLRHNLNFIVDQSVNFTFSYPPLWLCWWTDTLVAVFGHFSVMVSVADDEKDARKSADRYNTVNGLPSISDIYELFSHDYHEHRQRSQLHNPRKSQSQWGVIDFQYLLRPTTKLNSLRALICGPSFYNLFLTFISLANRRKAKCGQEAFAGGKRHKNVKQRDSSGR